MYGINLPANKEIKKVCISRINKTHLSNSQFKKAITLIRENKYFIITCSSDKQREELKKNTRHLTYAVVTDKITSFHDFKPRDYLDLASIITDIARYTDVRYCNHRIILVFYNFYDNKTPFSKNKYTNEIKNDFISLLLWKDKNGKIHVFPQQNRLYNISSNMENNRESYIWCLISKIIHWNAKKHCFYINKNIKLSREIMNQIVFSGNFPIIFKNIAKSPRNIKVISSTYHNKTLENKYNNYNSLIPINHNNFIQEIIKYNKPNLYFFGNQNAKCKINSYTVHISKETCQKHHQINYEKNKVWLIANTLSQMKKMIAKKVKSCSLCKWTYNIFKVSNRMYIAMNPASNDEIRVPVFPNILCQGYPKGFSYKAKLHKALTIFGANQIKFEGKINDSYLSVISTVGGIALNVVYKENGKYKSKNLHKSEHKSKALKHNKAFKKYIAKV